MYPAMEHQEYRESEIVKVDDVDFNMIEMKTFDINEFKELNEKLEAGAIKINIRATALIFVTFIKIIKHIIESLEVIDNIRSEIGNIEVKVFIGAYLKLDLGEYILYAAFTAPSNQLFYQSEDS